MNESEGLAHIVSDCRPDRSRGKTSQKDKLAFAAAIFIGHDGNDTALRFLASKMKRSVVHVLCCRTLLLCQGRFIVQIGGG